MDLLHRRRCHPRLLFRRGSMCVLFVRASSATILCLSGFFLALLEPERSDHVPKAPRCSVYPGGLCPSYFWVASEKCKHASLADIAGTRLLRPSHSFGSIFQDILLTSADEFVTGRVFPRKCESQSIRTIQGIVSFPVGRDPGAEPAKIVQGSSTLLSIELH